MSQYSVGNTVLLCKKREGIVRYVGPVHGHRGTFYGIELTKGSGDTDGSIKTKRYFKCSASKGKFVPAASIVSKKKKAKKRANSALQAPPRKKRKIMSSRTSPSTSPSTSDNDDHNPLNDHKDTAPDDYQPVISRNTKRKKRKRQPKTYQKLRRNRVSNSKKFDDPFETNDEEMDSSDEHDNAHKHSNDDDPAMDVDHSDDIENVEPIDDDDLTSKPYQIELESINNEIESLTVNKLKHYLKSLQSLTNKEAQPLFTDCSLKGRKKQLINKIKEKLQCIYAKDLKTKSKKHYTNRQFKEWKESVQQFVTEAKELKSPKKADKSKSPSNKANKHSPFVDHDAYDDPHSDSPSQVSQVLTSRRSSRLHSKSKPDYVDTPSQHTNGGNEDEDEDADEMMSNAQSCTQNNDRNNVNHVLKSADGMETTHEVADDNDAICARAGESEEGHLSIEAIMKGLQRLKQVNENELKKKEIEMKEKESKIKELTKEMNELKETFKTEMKMKEDKVSKLSEKNKRRKQEIFVLKRKNEIQRNTIKEHEEAIEEKDGMIQEREEQNKKLTKVQKESKQLITKQQNEIVELKIYKELYDNDQDVSLTQCVDE